MAGPASGATLSNGLEKGGMSQEPKGRARQASVGATESTILQSMGLYPSHGDASPSWSRAWCIAILCGILVCGGMAISLLIYVQPSFSNLWLPNSVVIGFLIGTTWRERMLILPIFFCLNVIGNFLMRRPVSFAFATAANNLAEVFFVSFTTTFLASTFSKRPGVAVNLTCVWHVSAFGIGLAWTFVRALCGAYIVQATTTLTNNKTLASLVFQFLDLAPICFTSPFIIAMLYDPPNLLASFRAKPYHGIVFIAVSFLICGAPMSIVPAMPMYAVSPSIIGLYISWPLIGILAAIGGLKGVTFGLLLSGLASTVLIPFRKYHSTACQIPTEDIRRDALFWTQICLLIECLASLIFNVALSQVERARQSIEREVRIRTEELEQAKARAEQADKNKALFLHFLCHELRNPLHAMSNLTELLIEERAYMDDSESESESNSIGSFKPVSRPGARAPHTSKDAGCAWSRAVDTTALVSDPGSDPVRAISLCTNYMLSLLSDTLDVGRFENGAVKLEKVPTDLYAMLAEVSAMAKARANSKRLRFKLEVSPEVPNWVEIDPLRLQQVINNLLSNSFKFTPTGGTVTLFVDAFRAEPFTTPEPRHDPPTIIPIETRDSSSLDTFVTVPLTPVRRGTLGSIPPLAFRLHVRCSDTGVGIPPESLATLFDPWTQAARSTSTEYGGSGLGLAIAAQIVELFEGEIRAESQVGVGTTFIFELPIKVARPDPGNGSRGRQRALSPPGAQTSAMFRSLPASFGGSSLPPPWERAKLPVHDPIGVLPSVDMPTSQVSEPPSSAPTLINGPISRHRTRRILVTDDSAINRKILVRMLTQSVKKLFPGEEFVVEEAENGKEAVDMITKDAESDKEFELIFMDVVMPVMDGFAATREIRRIPDISPHIIFASANQMESGDDGGFNTEWARAGGDDALTKPFGRAAVEGLLRKYCKLSQRTEE